jgi:hypothetical protein
MAALILTDGGATAHPQIDALKRELYAALKAMKPKDLIEADFDLFVLLEGEFEE